MHMLARLAFRPAMRLMRQLRLPVKLAVMGGLLLVPMLLLAVAQYRSLVDERDTALSEHHGATRVAAWMQAAGSLQRLRTLTARQIGGDGTAQADIETARQALVGHLELLQRLADAKAELAPPAAWGPLQATTARLAQGKHATQRDEAHAEFDAAIEAIGRLNFEIAEQSKLLLDPVASTYFMMDVVVTQLLPYADAQSRLVAHAVSVLARGEASGRDRQLLAARAGEVSRATHEIDARLAALQRAGSPPPAAWTATRQATSALIQLSGQDLAGTDPGAVTPAALNAATAAAQKAADTLATELAGTLKAELEARAVNAQHALVAQMALVALGLGLVVYLGVAFYTSFYGSLTALHRGVARVAAGDLSERIVLEGRDEMADIGRMVEDMNARLSAMVAEIRSSAVRVGMAGQVVADGSQSLAQRTDEQSGSLRRTLASAQSLSQAVSANAAAAGELDRLTHGLRADAEAGGAAMQQTVASMQELEVGSKRMGEIIGVIDGIAFRTNILALNAAVEAARAGDAGRGFAVVATEVRQLAQRSAAAAGEIRTLIGQSAGQVQASVSRIQQAGTLLGSLVGGVRTSSDSLRGIASASAQQSAELEQVASSVGSLDGITRENAKLVTESSAASRELVTRARQLAEAVASIKLRQGSADEAKALVDRALPLLKSAGLQGAAATLRSREQGFVDRDLYVFVVDGTGAYRLHGAKPAMEGKRVHEVPGIDGDRFVRDCRRAAEQGGGWVEYEIVNPENGKVMPKVSYVVGLNKEQFVGCGVYRHDQASKAAPSLAPQAGAAAQAVSRPAAPTVKRARMAA